MAVNEFSKKMCHELLVLEDYIMGCKNAPFQKDKVIVDKYKILEVMTSLRAYHCADRNKNEEKEIESAENDGVQTFVINKEKPIKKEEPIERNVAPKNNDSDINEFIENKRLEAMRALELEMQNRRKEEEEKLLMRVKNAQMVADQSLEDAKDNTVDSTQMVIGEAELEAKRIVGEAKINADYMISQAETKINVREEEINALLEQKINEAEKKAQQIIEDAQNKADEILENNVKEAADVTLAGFKRAEGFVEQVEEVYAKQLKVIKEDRDAIVSILQKLEDYK